MFSEPEIIPHNKAMLHFRIVIRNQEVRNTVQNWNYRNQTVPNNFSISKKNSTFFKIVKFALQDEMIFQSEHYMKLYCKFKLY